MDKLVKSLLSKGRGISVRIRVGAPDYADVMELVFISDLKSEFSEFESRYPHQYGISIMDNTVGFYPTNVGSIPACRTRDKCRWNQLDRYWIANPWK